MKLGTYTFRWVPDKFTIPKADKINSFVITYSNVAYFTWGMSIIGKVITLEWKWMSAEQFLRLQDIADDDEQKVWYPELPYRIWYENAVNHPFITGKTVTGLISSATGLISAVDTIENNLTLTNINGTFQTENFEDNSAPKKTGTITALEIVPNYNVQVFSPDGVYFEDMQANFVWRQDIKLKLLIMSVAS